MNRQEIFDKVVTHLYKQGKPCRNENGCLYRDNEGNSCAIGCLISDENYNPIIESHGMFATSVQRILCKEIGNITNDDIDFLNILQCMHDGELWLYVYEKGGKNSIAKQQFSEIDHVQSPEVEKETWNKYLKFCSKFIADKEGLKCPLLA